MLDITRKKGRSEEEERLAEQRSALLIQLGRVEEKLDNLSNKMSFEHGHIREDTQFTAGAVRDMSPTLVELEHLKRDLLERMSEAVSPAPTPQPVVRNNNREDKISDGILELMGDLSERSVTEIATNLQGSFPEYAENSLRVVVSRKLGRLVGNGKLDTREVKNKRLYRRKI